MPTELPPKLETNLQTLAKWAARVGHETGSFEAGGEVAYMLAKAAEIRRDGTPEQRQAALEAVRATHAAPSGSGDAALLADIRALNAKLNEISGHEGVKLR